VIAKIAAMETTPTPEIDLAVIRMVLLLSKRVIINQTDVSASVTNAPCNAALIREREVGDARAD
jgi:hypothetical protein